MRAALRSNWVLAGLLAVVTWPVADLAPQAGLDPSWAAGLYMAAHQGLDFGRDIVFTFGPLGFLHEPALYYPKLTALALVYTAAIQYCCCLAALYAARRSFALLPALLLTFVAASVLGEERVVALAFLISILALDPRSPAPLRRAVPIGGGFLVALELYGKLSTGGIVAALLLVAVAGSSGRPWRGLAEFGVSLVASLLFLWLVAAQSLTALPTYLLEAGAVVAGYSAAMEAEDPELSWEYWAAAVAAVLFALAAFRTTSTWEARRRVTAMVLTGVFIFGLFKSGFIRQDPGHSAIFFTALPAAWLAWRWRPDTRAFAALAFVLLFVTYLGVAGGEPSGVIDPLERAKNLTRNVRTMLDRERRLEVEGRGRATIAATYGLDPRLVDLVGEEEVHVAPWDAGVAWAYFLNWKPLPVFQDYAAYSPGLDELNAEALREDDAPARVLRQIPPFLLDNRFQPHDSPKATLELLCRYRVLRRSGSWEVLARGSDRCGPARDLGTVEAGWGEKVDVPSGRSDEAVLVRIEGAGLGAFERLRSLFYKPERREIWMNGTGFRLIAAVAGEGLLLHVPPELDHDGAFALAPNARRIAVTKGGRQRDGGELRYEFFAVPLDGPAA